MGKKEKWGKIQKQKEPQMCYIGFSKKRQTQK